MLRKEAERAGRCKVQRAETRGEKLQRKNRIRNLLSKEERMEKNM
jgi:hypothetical protein